MSNLKLICLWWGYLRSANETLFSLNSKLPQQTFELKTTDPWESSEAHWLSCVLLMCAHDLAHDRLRHVLSCTYHLSYTALPLTPDSVGLTSLHFTMSSHSSSRDPIHRRQLYGSSTPYQQYLCPNRLDRYQQLQRLTVLPSFWLFCPISGYIDNSGTVVATSVGCVDSMRCSRSWYL
jgi:hypothetical protein